MSSSFKPLTNIRTNFLPDVGDSVLWRGVKIGPHGQPSTKCEYFNAKLRHKAVDSDNEFWFYVDRLAVKEVRRVHQSYLESLLIPGWWQMVADATRRQMCAIISLRW